MSEIVGEGGHEYDRQQRPEYRADGVERLPQAEGGAAQTDWREIGDQRVARRTTDALTDAVDEARPDHPADIGGERKHWLGDRRQAIADNSQPFAFAQIVADDTGKHLGDRSGGFGDAFDDTDLQR